MTIGRLTAAVAGISIAAAIAGWVFILDTRGAMFAEVYGLRGGSGLIVPGFTIIGALICTRSRGNLLGWMFLITGALMGLAVFGEGYAAKSFVDGPLPLADLFAWAQNWLWVAFFGFGVIYPLMLFPDGKLPSPRWRWLPWTAPLSLAPMAFTIAFEGGQLQSLPLGYHNPYAFITDGSSDGWMTFLGPMMMVSVIGSISAIVVRFRRSRGDEREQMKWIVFAGAFSALGILANMVAGAAGVETESLLLKLVASYTMLSIAGIAVAAGVAILRYRLYEIDLVISRTITFGALAVTITVIYVAIVAGIGAAIGRGDEPNLALSIFGTAIVAVIFQPLRASTHRFADRLVYGRRATTDQVLSELGSGIAGAYSVEEALPRLARLVVDATTADRAAVWLVVGATLQRAGASSIADDVLPPVPLLGDELPPLPDADRTFAVRHGTEVLGAITVGVRAGESISPADERLLADIAGHAALVMRNARLIAELQASRQRLVAAQDTERRRIERNIHDGAQQQLVALAVNLRVARSILDTDVATAGTMLDQIRSDAGDALENLRALARGIYPPLLAEKGLAPALRGQAERAALPVEVVADGIGRYPQEVEATAYFCVLESLQNVAKYASASAASVTLSERDRGLSFVISDNGTGFDPRTAPAGAGLSNMRDRIEAIGGTLEVASRPGAGTTISAWVPAPLR